MNPARRNPLNAFRRDQSGAALAEYSILIGLIAAVAFVIVGVVGNQVNSQYQSITTEWQNATSNTETNGSNEQDEPDEQDPDLDSNTNG